MFPIIDERNSEVLADHGPGDGKNLPVHVGDHVGGHSQAEDDVAHVCGPGSSGGAGRRAEVD